jgi:hypothetical protein
MTCLPVVPLPAPGVLHLINKAPIDWYSKKQVTVEMATYGSEFVAARTCINQIVDLRTSTTLHYLGVPISITLVSPSEGDKSIMFGDNKTVADSSTVPHAKLHKQHNALSFHRASAKLLLPRLLLSTIWRVTTILLIFSAASIGATNSRDGVYSSHCFSITKATWLVIFTRTILML